MSAVNAIINNSCLLFLAVLLTLHCQADSLAASREVPAAVTDSLVDLLNKMTEQEGPSAVGNGVSVAKTNGITRVTVQDIIDTNDRGEHLRLPSYVFCDHSTNETYVLDGGRLLVYGDDHFPVASIGQGRGLRNAMGVTVDDKGFVYIASATNRPSILIYNAAFLPEREIVLDGIPQYEGGNPKSIAIGKNGYLYIAFSGGVRGVLVLDPGGGFSHWLRPTDLIFDRQAIVESTESRELEEEVIDENETAEEPDFDVSELLPELVPEQSEQVFADEVEPGMGPVQINDVQRDEAGNLYLLSTETSKVYIYTPDEEYLYSFGEKGGSTGKMSQPNQLVVDETKRAIYIVDPMRQAILIFDLSGRFMHEFGGQGNRPGWFQFPKSITTNSKGEVLVADMFNRRVQVLDVHFRYLFPVFQVPFVYEKNEIYQPQPMQAANDMFYGPGFDPGEQAAVETPVEKDRKRIESILQSDDGVI